LAEAWRRLGFSRLTLDVIECQDRRVARSAAELAAQVLADGQTEVSVLIPRREYKRFWHRLLHDRTSDRVAAALSLLPHCNVTVVPYHLGAASLVAAPAGADGLEPIEGLDELEVDATSVAGYELGDFAPPDGCTPIGSARHRQRVVLGGRVHAVRVQPWSGVATLELTLVDRTGAMTIVFLGRRHLPGVGTGTRLVVQGMVGEHRGHLAILNPAYDILPGPEAEANDR
jgi:hypothetical protein